MPIIINFRVFMQKYEPYILQIKQVCLQIYHHQLFSELAIVLTMCLFFVLGRMSHEKRLTHLLDMINDAENTRKKLSAKLESEDRMLKSLQNKSRVIIIVTVVFVAVHLANYLITKLININLIIYSSIPVICIWAVYIFGRKYLKWNRNATEKKIKGISITADAQIKEILRLFGEGLKERLKNLYEAEVDIQTSKQSKQQCKLYNCYNEKKSYEDLFKLYDEIINEIKKINLCDICLNEENISVQKLGLNELENMVRNYRKIKAGKMAVGQKKEMVNKLLGQYQKVNEKLPHICKKGCCIKQRVVIENAKNKFYDRLKKTHAQLDKK